MTDSSLPFSTPSEQPIRGTLKGRPEDFRVEEVPAYEPVGAGEHLFVHFEKTGLDTKEAVRRIAGVLGVEARDAGFAGLKDRHAVTTQWASFHRGDPTRLETAAIEGVRIVEAKLHGNKLRTGHLRGNRFVIRVRPVPGESTPAASLEAARSALDALARGGVPNYYGEQRFGRDRGNTARARAWLVGGGRAPRDSFERKLLVSVLQSELFNELCSARVREGMLGSVILGDLCRKEETGGLFVVEDLEAERERAARFEISATGPMFGAKMRWPEADAKLREEETLARAELDQEKLARFAKWGEGTRRPYRVRLGAPSVEADGDDLVIAFELPAGAYATIVLRELTREN
ncbi:MAG: tRNA pseudouridine(13) synthase TruD [Myxococcota bacterium]|nr:tRNA pseudouridine(13) synthase TruD [Myxococcota bacterium]